MPTLEIESESGRATIEGMEFQIRTQPAGQRFTYPLSADTQQLFESQLALSHHKLRTSKLAIDEFFASTSAPPHSAPPNCARCTSIRQRELQIFQDYYLPSDPDHWSFKYPEYREQMERVFNNPAGYTQEALHEVYRSMFREHHRRNLCCTDPDDEPGIVALKEEISQMFAERRKIADILEVYQKEYPLRSSKPIAEYWAALSSATSPEERAQAHIRYHCRSISSDSPTTKNLKTKYARLFEQLTPVDEVLAAWRKEAAEVKEQKVKALQTKLQGLQWAHSAHLKKEAKKKEKRDKRLEDRSAASRPRILECALDACRKEVDIKSEVHYECAICAWVGRRSGDLYRHVYCCEEHGKEDFRYHIEENHSCCMQDLCLKKSQEETKFSGPVSGICKDCAAHDVVSFFCSQACYSHNLESHHEVCHDHRGIQNKSTELDLCILDGSDDGDRPSDSKMEEDSDDEY